MTVTNPGGPVAADVLPLVLVHAEDPDPVQSGGISVGQVPAGCQGQLVGLVPADAQPAGAGFHAHAVSRHALQNPAGHPVGYRLTVVGGLWDRGPEDGDLAVVIDADQPGYADVQQAGVPGDGQVREPAFDMVANSAGVPAVWAAEVDGHRMTVEVGDVAGVGGVVDRQAQLDGAADRVGDEVRGRGGGDGRVRHGSWSGWMDA
jgi:hypothetical protein